MPSRSMGHVIHSAMPTPSMGSSRMITQCYNERIHDDGCKVVETTRQEQNNIRVQRGVCRGD